MRFRRNPELHRRLTPPSPILEHYPKLYQDISEPNCRRVVRVSVETVDLVAQIDGEGGASRPGGPPAPPTAAESQAPYTYPDFRYPVPMAAER